MQIITVSALNKYLKSLLDNDQHLKDLYVRGEISNFKRHIPSGHLYFTLKDEKSSMRAVMFKGSASRLKFEPENGLAVIVRGSIALYERDGSTQIYVSDIQPEGIGALNLAFEQTKNRLEKEGLFDSQYKKEIPPYPEKIGIITSSTGAALQDIKNVLSRRYPSAELFLISTLVQGKEAAPQIAAAIKQMDAMDMEVMIIGRGGGSLEDLWPFNEEVVARAIFNAKTPIISAVGHEVDFTISDFVSDLRAPTPSAAAELATPDVRSVLQTIDAQFEYSTRLLKARMENLRLRTETLARATSMERLKLKTEQQRLRLEQSGSQMKRAITYKINGMIDRVATDAKMLEALCPYRLLERGYILGQKEGTWITSINELHPGDEICLRFHDGEAEALIQTTKQVEEIENG